MGKINRKNVWLVRGSEDGNIAVTTNFKLAYKVAADYLAEDVKNSILHITVRDDKAEYGYRSQAATERNARKEANRGYGHVTIFADSSSVTIEQFTLNYYRFSK